MGKGLVWGVNLRIPLAPEIPAERTPITPVAAVAVCILALRVKIFQTMATPAAVVHIQPNPVVTPMKRVGAAIPPLRATLIVMG